MKTAILCSVFVALAGSPAPDNGAAIPQGAAWELSMLGVPPGPRLEAVRKLPRRPVILAIVGQGGVSRSLLAPLLHDGTTIDYRCGATDPGTETHDTSAARVILDLTHALGLKVRVTVYQPGESWDEVAAAMARAGDSAHVVAFFQSFWGPNIGLIVKAIAAARRALFISPYAEYGGFATKDCVQGYSAKPWAKKTSLPLPDIPHFLTAAPLPRSTPGQIVQPASGPDDAEVINFIVPSYYASGPGGTCPAAEVLDAVALYIIASAPRRPDPVEVANLLRKTVRIDRQALTSVPEYDSATVDRVEQQIRALANPPEGRPRKLDAAGVVNLWQIYKHLARP